MIHWRDEYVAALRLRDIKEKHYNHVYSAYTKLADEKSKNVVAGSVSNPLLESRIAASGNPGGSSLNPSIVSLREGFAEAQQGRLDLHRQLTTVIQDSERLKLQLKTDAARLGELISERTILLQKIRDRDEELRGKSKLVEDVHDESVSLILELNMAEEKLQKLRLENKELIDRWMARVGQEADAMNTTSKFS